MSKHTPEPWHSDAAGFIYAKVDGVGDSMVAEVRGFGRLVHGNRDRIVACVNACKGLADPSVVPELLESLETLMDWQNGPPTVTNADKWQAAMDRASKAVAKARG